MPFHFVDQVDHSSPPFYAYLSDSDTSSTSKLRLPTAPREGPSVPLLKAASLALCPTAPRWTNLNHQELDGKAAHI